MNSKKLLGWFLGILLVISCNGFASATEPATSPPNTKPPVSTIVIPDTETPVSIQRTDIPTEVPTNPPPSTPTSSSAIADESLGEVV